MVIFKGGKGYERAAGAKFFGVYDHFKGGNRGTSAPQARKFWVPPIFQISGVNSYQKVNSYLSPKIKSITPSLRGGGN